MNIQENKLSVNVPTTNINLNEIKPMNTTNTTVTLLSQVIEQLKQDDSVTMQAYSEYSSDNGYERIYDNDGDELGMMFTDTHEALRAAFYGDYNPTHAYFTFNGYGNLQSFGYLDSDNSPIDYEELAQWIIDNESYSEYDLDIMTIDDMLASIEDNITDDEEMLIKLADYLTVNLNADYDDNIADVMNLLSDYDYDQLQEIITLLGINY